MTFDAIRILLKNGRFSDVIDNSNCHITGTAMNYETCKYCKSLNKYYIVHHTKNDDMFIAVYPIKNNEIHVCNNKSYFTQMYVGFNRIIEYDFETKTYSEEIVHV